MSPQGRKRVAEMVSRNYRTVSGVGQTYHNQQQQQQIQQQQQQQQQPANFTNNNRRNGQMTMNQRSHSAAPSENYRSTSPRRGSLSPQDDRYLDYPVLPIQPYAPRFQSRSATATPTGSPKKRQLPHVSFFFIFATFYIFFYKSPVVCLQNGIDLSFARKFGDLAILTPNIRN